MPAVALLLAALAAPPADAVTNGPAAAAFVVATLPATGVAAGAARVAVRSPGQPDLVGQVGPPALGSPAAGRVVTVVIPAMAAGETRPVAVRPAGGEPPPGFTFAEGQADHTDTLFAGRPVVRFVHRRHDPAAHELTFKPFHHVFDPADGRTLITAGAGLAADKTLLYPHHRGLFFGWMKAGYGATVADTWHGRAGVFTQVERVLLADAGPVYARHRSLIRWVGPDGLQFAEEQREVTAYAAAGGTLLDFVAVVGTKLPKVTLDGDPQHAGVHFRAAQDVATLTRAQTVFTRPDGPDAPGKTRNWPADATQVDLAFDAMTVTTGGKPYSVVTVPHPDNPKPARFSEREYGRLGSYFVATVTPKAPVTVRTRLWVKAGGVTVGECAAVAAGVR